MAGSLTILLFVALATGGLAAKGGLKNGHRECPLFTYSEDFSNLYFGPGLACPDFGVVVQGGEKVPSEAADKQSARFEIANSLLAGGTTTFLRVEHPVCSGTGTLTGFTSASDYSIPQGGAAANTSISRKEMGDGLVRTTTKGRSVMILFPGDTSEAEGIPSGPSSTLIWGEIIWDYGEDSSLWNVVKGTGEVVNLCAHLGMVG